MNAEQAYLFRHALLRDAAYQLQLPGDRARLHALAFDAIEILAGGRAPAAPPLEPGEPFKLSEHPSDYFAEDLADHARLAVIGDEEGMREARSLYLRRAAEHAEGQFRQEEASRLWCLFADLVSGTQRGESLRRAAVAALHAGRPRIAGPLFEQAVAAMHESGDRRAEGIAKGNLALFYQETGRIELSESLQKEAISIHREVGNRAAEGKAVGNLAIVYWDTGREDLAVKSSAEALAIHREVGNRQLEGAALGNLAVFEFECGHFDRAEQNLAQSLAIHRETGNRRSEGNVLGSLAVAYRDSGRVELAESTFSEALAIHREVGNRRFEASMLGHVAILHWKAGRLELAGREFDEALAIDRDMCDLRSEGAHLCDYARFLLARGRAGAARDSWRRGASILQQVGDVQTLKSKREFMQRDCTGAGVPPFDGDPA